MLKKPEQFSQPFVSQPLDHREHTWQKFGNLEICIYCGASRMKNEKKAVPACVKLSSSECTVSRRHEKEIEKTP